MLNFWLSWMLQPILAFMYLMQYCPFIGFFVINKVTLPLSCNIIWKNPPAYYVECILLELEVPSWMTSCGRQKFQKRDCYSIWLLVSHFPRAFELLVVQHKRDWCADGTQATQVLQGGWQWVQLERLT